MRDEPKLPLYRLDEHATRTFVDAILSGKRPIAIVGSGLSLIYGGVTWEESVELALSYAIECLTKVKGAADGGLLDKHIDQIDRARLDQQLKALKTYYPDGSGSLLEKVGKSGGPLSSSADKYVALDLCAEALALVDKIEDLLPKKFREPGEVLHCPILAKARERHNNLGRFRGFMAQLYKNDTQLLRYRISRRFELNDELVKELNILSDQEVHYLSSEIFNVKFIRKILTDNPVIHTTLFPLVEEIEQWMKWLVENNWAINPCVIPVDRRSILNIFLAEISADQRRFYFEEMLNKVKESDSVNLKLSAQRPLLDPIQSAERWFGLRRFMTLNFDYQLERALMLDDHVAIDPPPADLESAVDKGLLRRDPDTGALDRMFPDGLVAASDLYKQEALGRLFEFGLNSPDYQAHILHLHGRADEPSSMLLTDTDSNRQYRRDPDAADMLEHALDVALTGNPILFMGVGLSEPEITRALRELVSRSDASLEQPAFTTQMLPSGAKESDSSGWRMQQSYLRQNGIHVFVVGANAGGSTVEPPSHGHQLAQQLSGIGKRNESCQPNLAQSNMILGELEKHVKYLSGDNNFKLKDVKDIIEKARTLWFVDIDNLWMDNSTFLFFIDNIIPVDVPVEGPVSSQKACSWLDYLSALKKKTAALAQVSMLRMLRDAIATELQSPLLADEYDDLKIEPVPPKGLTVQGVKPSLRIRDEQFSKILDRTKWIQRHVSSNKFQRQYPKTIDDNVIKSEDILLLTGSFGVGKGSVGSFLRDYIPGPGLFINLCFSVEIDSVISHILRFISFHRDVSLKGLVNRVSQIRDVLRGVPFSPSSSPLVPIVLSGIERLFDREGKILVAEFEFLMKTLLHPDLAKAGFRLILLGTEGCSKVFENIAQANGVTLEKQNIGPEWREFNLIKHLNGLVTRRCEGRSYLRSLNMNLGLAMTYSAAPLVPNGVRSRQSSEVLKLVIQRWHDLHDIDRAEAEVDRAILGALAFIGMPIEAEGLVPMPSITRRFDGVSPVEILKGIKGGLVRLGQYGLVIVLEARASDDPELQAVDPKVSNPPHRYALHRSVMAELRENLSARSGEEPISNSFSITLAASMPTDLKLPDTHVLEELELALSRLRGAWKDASSFDDRLNQIRVEAQTQWQENPMSQADIARWRALEEFEQAVRMCDKPMAIYQRAAAGIIRGFFSGASLVGQFPTGLKAPPMGWMEHHKRRIGKLLRQVRDSQQADKRAELISEEIKEKLKTKADLIKEMVNETKNKAEENREPHALYGNEILWLLNEQAVIAIIQGCLQDARRLLNDADKANRLFRSEEPGSVTWRRLEINRSYVMIERGQIAEAYSRLLAIQPAVENRKLGLKNEDDLTQPLIDSYLGLCDHLSGRYDDAEKKFIASINRARRTKQQRTQAISHIRLAILQFGRGEIEPSKTNIQDAIAIAQNGRQMDIVWRAKTASCSTLRNQNRRREADEIIDGALAYANEMGIPRLRVEALKQRAELALALGDSGSAAQATAAAMATATRNGMVLQRTSLRIIMGRILLHRGDKSGLQLLNRAAVLADRIGYQLMVERALSASNSHSAVWRPGAS